ncbi:MAG: hypothetical protein ACYTG0_00510 [Planctomycetota bacterium]|jgi:hypothetical protein
MKWHGRILLLGTMVLMAVVLTPPAGAAEPVEEGGWLVEEDNVRTMEMTLHPKGEPRPALKHRLLPDDFDMVDGNAAVYYLKAMGFLEQDPARDRLRKVFAEARERVEKEGKSYGDFPPHSWQSMKPEELPLDEVKEFLKLTSFQPGFLEEARQRRVFDLDRNLREVDDPYAYLLPEIQAMRELARRQTVRCKVAIAEGRIDDAIAILGQQYAMARHLGQDEFLVTGLVGIACGGIAWDDALYLVQHPDAPNLYWAFASLPRPLVDVRHALSVERQMFYLQFKALREVDETPRPVGYWRDFLDRLIPQFGLLASDFGMPWANDDPEVARAVLVASVAAAYPGAKRYLIDDCGLSAEQVEAYPTAQAVFLAVVRYYDEARDDYFKWAQLPYWQAALKTRDLEPSMGAQADRVGWIATPSDLLLPAVIAVRTAAARIEQQLALSQTVEAIRMYGAAHDGKLPKTLDDLPLPAPPEPFNGKPLDYRYHGDHAVLNGHDMPGLRYRLVLRFAEKTE